MSAFFDELESQLAAATERRARMPRMRGAGSWRPTWRSSSRFRLVAVSIAVVVLGISFVSQLSGLQRSASPVSARPSDRTYRSLGVLRTPPENRAPASAIHLADSSSSVRSVSAEASRRISADLSLVPAVVVKSDKTTAEGLCLVKADAVACGTADDVDDIRFLEASSDGTTHVYGLAADAVAEAVFMSSSGSQVTSAVINNAYELHISRHRAPATVNGPDGSQIPAPATPAKGDVVLKSPSGATLSQWSIG